MVKTDVKTYAGRAAADRRLLIIFVILLILGAVTGILGTWTGGTLSLGEVPSIVVGTIQMAFLIVGIPATAYYAKNGLVSAKHVIGMFAKASLVIAAVLTVAAAIAFFFNVGDIEFGDVPSSGFGLVAVAVGLYIGGYLGVFLFFLIGLILGIGAISVMAAVARSMTPRILAEIAGSERKSLKERAIAWFFCIPDALDVHTLTIGSAKTEKLQWDGIKRAVIWEVILGAVLCVYVSFNTIEAGTSTDSIYGMFSSLINISVFVPLIVLPWFVFLGLDAKLKGAVKDFTLYDGIKSRVFRSYIAISTLLIFVRLTLSRVEAVTYLLGFAAYLISLTAVSVAFTYIYFNFFAGELSSDISAEFGNLRQSSK